jgi:hypothetical protein
MTKGSLAVSDELSNHPRRFWVHLTTFPHAITLGYREFNESWEIPPSLVKLLEMQYAAGGKHCQHSIQMALGILERE